MKRITAAVAGLLVLTLSLLVMADATTQPDAGQTDLKLFDKDAQWNFNSGPEYPGATGSFDVGSDGDKPVATLKYDFSGGGNYVDAGIGVNITKPVELRFSVKSDGGQKILIRLIDSTGQCHQYVRPYSSVKDWQQIHLNLDKKSGE